jgi:hypothetical protein
VLYRNDEGPRLTYDEALHMKGFEVKGFEA